jgi:glycosyltransferase involved in cell wall biosynthesis
MAQISIIIPVYNTEHFLKKCLEALINQTFPDIEILCINDGSTDASLEILREYEQKDKRIKVFNQANSGASSARNIGLDNAMGRYIMFCDSDDTYEPTMCEAMFNAIEGEQVDLVMCDCNVIEFDKKHGRSQSSIEYKRLKIKGKRTIDISLSIGVNIWNKIFKKKLIDEYKILFPKHLQRHEDNAFYYQYISISKTYFGLDMTLYNHYLREDSLSGEYYSGDMRQKFDRIVLFNAFLDFLQKHNIVEKNMLFFAEKLNMSLFELWTVLLKKSDQYKALELTKDVLMRLTTRDFYNPILKLIIDGEYKKVIERFNKKADIKFILGIRIKKSKNNNNEIYSIGKKQIYRKERVADEKNYYFFGVKIYRKNKLSCWH